jgi:hypothetical protein
MLTRNMLLLLICLSSTCLWAEQEASQLNDIAQQSEWRALLHFYADQKHSLADDERFFLSPGGSHSPRAELDATLAAFYQTTTNLDDINQHPLCRFPARWLYLSEQLQLPAPPLTLTDCPEYQQWLTGVKPHSVSLIFASAYLNSPSSMFGHTFLRIDPANVEETGSNWLSFAVNFGAKIDGDDSSIMYAYRGLFGGYPGFFGVIPYYEKIKEYSRIENRDLWEYNLNLTPEETSRMVNHLWELREINFDYYFFDENCSYRLLELLEYARPAVSLREGFGLRAIPIDTIRAVADAGLVDSVTWRPAVTTKNQFEIDQLPPDSQQLAWQLAQRAIAITDERITALPDLQRGQIYRVAYEQLRYQQLERKRDPEAAQFSLDLLKALNKTGAKEHTPPTPQVRPEQGHRTLLAGLGGGELDDSAYADLRIRLSYHDLADNTAGYLRGAAINLGELRLRKLQGDNLQIENLNFIDINSHSPRSLFFDPITWRIKLGFERIYSEQDDDLVAQVSGGAGVTYAIGKPVLIYGLGTTRLEYNELLKHNWTIGLGALAGTLVYFPFGTLQLESNYYQFSDGLERYQHQLIQNIPMGRNNAVRLTASHHKQVNTNFDEFNLEFRHYF